MILYTRLHNEMQRFLHFSTSMLHSRLKVFTLNLRILGSHQAAFIVQTKICSSSTSENLASYSFISWTRTNRTATNYQSVIRAKKVFNSSLISSSSSNPRKLWNCINKLLHRKSQLPSTIDSESLPSMFASFFSDKVFDIHSALKVQVINTSPPTESIVISQLISFSLVLLLNKTSASLYLSHPTPSATLICDFSETVPVCTSS